MTIPWTPDLLASHLGLWLAVRRGRMSPEAVEARLVSGSWAHFEGEVMETLFRDSEKTIGSPIDHHCVDDAVLAALLYMAYVERGRLTRAEADRFYGGRGPVFMDAVVESCIEQACTLPAWN